MDNNVSVYAVIQLMKDMDEFVAQVTEESKKMKNRADALGEYWKDAQYVEFNNFILDLYGGLTKDLTPISNASGALNKMARIMLQK